MQKKKIILLIILALIIIGILALIFIKPKRISPMQMIATAEYSTTIEKIEYDITNAVQEPSKIVPTISAGMIPIKYENGYWKIADKNNWYDYSKGQPAYIMLNDGYYKSELEQGITDDQLASKLVGADASVRPKDLGTIYMWIPRFAYNSNGEIIYIKNCYTVSGTWNLPEMFTYKIENERIPDLSLAGVWISVDILDDTNGIIDEMNNEEGIYGFIANTKPRQITKGDISIIAGVQISSIIDDVSNTNRIILQIINTNETEPIKSKAYYNEQEEKIKIETTYTKNGIARILDEKGNELKFTEENGIIYADTGDKELYDSTYSFIIIDMEGNIRKVIVSGIIPKCYGKLVTNYQCNADGEYYDLKWRIFYKDKKNIYLIADDYVPYNNLPISAGGTALAKQGNYSAELTPVINEYTGSEWIIKNTDENAIKWLNWVTAYPDSTNTNIKATTYMMDTNIWGEKFAGSEAEYAIGGPTLELFCASYKVTHPNRYIEFDGNSSSVGYQMIWDSNPVIHIGELPTDEFNSIYVKSDVSHASGMWIGSPVTGADTFILRSHSNGDFHGTYYNAYGTRKYRISTNSVLK